MQDYKPSRGSINIGDSFGKLTCLSFLEKKNNRNYFKFLCDCGKECIKIGTEVKNGHVKSCGCLFKNYLKSQRASELRIKATNKVKLSRGEASFNVVYKTYITRAKKYKLEFTLTKNEFKYLTTQSCYYCGQKPRNIGGSKYNNGMYVYSGLDRIDNSEGYTLTNCVSCCKICNIAKNNMHYIDFLQHIEKIYERQKQWIKKSHQLKP